MDEVKLTAEVPPADTPDAASLAPLAGGDPEHEVSAQAWKKARELALRQLDLLVSLEPRALSGDDPDAVHGLRVASRRLQQVLDLLHPAPQHGEVRRLRKKVRRCRRALGEVRNFDVLLARVNKAVVAKRTSRRDAWLAVKDYLLKRRQQSLDRAARKLAKMNFVRFYAHLKGWIVPNGAAPQPSVERLAAPVFHERVAQDLAKSWKAFEARLALSHRDAAAPAVHRVRIAAKRFRYLIEVVNAFGVPGSDETLGWLRRLQRHLGNWHDVEVLEQMMIEMVGRPEFLRDHLELAMSVEKLIIRNRAAKKKFEEEYFGMTQSSAELERLRGWVSYVLASPSAAFATA